MIGLRELLLLATVALVLYGRSGVLKSRQFQAIRPWITPVRRHAGAGGGHGARSRGGAAIDQSRPAGRSHRFGLEGNRVFWFLTILAATAVAAWIITRSLILNGTQAGLTHRL